MKKVDVLLSRYVTRSGSRWHRRLLDGMEAAIRDRLAGGAQEVSPWGAPSPDLDSSSEG